MTVAAVEPRTKASKRKMIRVSERAHQLLAELAGKSGEPMSTVLDRAVDAYYRERFFDEMDAAYAALRADPEAWKEELEERKLWECTLMDGLKDDPPEASPLTSRYGLPKGA